MSELRAPLPLDFAKLLLLAAIWGSSFMCIEIALTAMPPLVVAAGRLLLAALTMLVALRLLDLSLAIGWRDWGLCIGIGLMNSALPFALVSWGQQHISSGRTAILIACSPFFALLLAHHFTGDDRFTVGKLLGVALGFSGVLSLIGGDVLNGEQDAVSGQLAIVCAALCYASASLLTRRLSHLPTLVSSAAMLIGASLVAPPVLLHAGWENLQSVSPSALLAVVWLGLIPTALGYLLRVQLVQQVGTTFMAQVAYLIPLFAVFWGWLFLDELPTTGAWLALVFVLAGMAASRLPGQTARNAKALKQAVADQSSAPK